jgi:putative endonuclease
MKETISRSARNDSTFSCHSERSEPACVPACAMLQPAQEPFPPAHCVLRWTSRQAGNLMREHNYYIYILTNWNHKVMYVGMTNDLKRRLYEHKNKLIEGFTKRYIVHKLVYNEHTTDVYAAIAREKEIKKWRREKKDNLVETMNPDWKDLSDEWV